MNGKIVKLKRSEVNFEKIKESDIQEVLGYISGRWTERIYFNKEVIFDINDVKPFKVTNESVPLLSDSNYREDMKLFREENIGLAQTVKENIE